LNILNHLFLVEHLILIGGHLVTSCSEDVNTPTKGEPVGADLDGLEFNKE